MSEYEAALGFFRRWMRAGYGRDEMDPTAHSADHLLTAALAEYHRAGDEERLEVAAFMLRRCGEDAARALESRTTLDDCELEYFPRIVPDLDIPEERKCKLLLRFLLENPHQEVRVAAVDALEYVDQYTLAQILSQIVAILDGEEGDDE